MTPKPNDYGLLIGVANAVLIEAALVALVVWLV